MAKARTLVGLDVHATKIVAAVLDGAMSCVGRDFLRRHRDLLGVAGDVPRDDRRQGSREIDHLGFHRDA
jgi:hypothetical protein